MRVFLWPMLLLIMMSGYGQQLPPGQRPVARFEVHGESRLIALARLGALTNTTLLIEAGSEGMKFLQTPIELTAEASNMTVIIARMLEGSEPFAVKERGSLLIVADVNSRSRVPTMSLGPFSFSGKSLSSLFPLLEYYVRLATGCNPQGYGYAGPPLDLDIPPFALGNATFEQVVERVADSEEASMWIIEADPSRTGCIDNPGTHWEVGLYGFGRRATGCDIPFRESIGRFFVIDPTAAQSSGQNCSEPQLPSSVPTFPAFR